LVVVIVVVTTALIVKKGSSFAVVGGSRHCVDVTLSLSGRNQSINQHRSADVITDNTKTTETGIPYFNSRAQEFRKGVVD